MTVHDHHKRTQHITIWHEKKITEYSRHLVRALAFEAQLSIVYVTSVERTVEDQAGTFFDKHVVEKTDAHYINPEVGKMIEHARRMRHEHIPDPVIKEYLFNRIEHAHGGPTSVSKHLGRHILDEIFDVGHYKGKGKARHNYMTEHQARAFLEACRKRIPDPITKLGHSEELGFKLSKSLEFPDENCFHLEVRQPLFENLISGRLFKEAAGVMSDEFKKARATMHSSDSKS